jgi:uncharacterized protein (TIGR00730 family)
MSEEQNGASEAGRHKHSPIASVTVFCGSSLGRRQAYRAAAAEFGRRLAEARLELVYGGGNVGLMAALADAALEAGGRVTGVMPRHLVDREIAHQGLTSLIVVENMHERKARMAALGDAFVALPGGPGTMEEFFEAWVWRQLGLHSKPVGLLDAEGYYESLAGFLDHVVAEGFMGRAYLRMLVVEPEPRRLIERLQSGS